MQKNKILDRLLAIILIFTLTFANFALVSKAYAASFVETIFGSRSETGSKNVGFEASFEVEGERLSSTISDVNNQDLAISTSIIVENEGYLQDAKITILEKENDAGLNFAIKNQEELPDFVQSIAENVIYLKQIDNSQETVKVAIPIEYQNEKYFDETNLSKGFIVRFSGIYMDGKGNEKEVSVDKELTLSWKDDREARVETAVEKYIDFGTGIVLQTKVKVDNTTSGNSLPVRKTELIIDAPTIEGLLPTNVSVTANSTMGTNGQGYGNTEFNENNWFYDENKHQVSIVARNAVQYIDINNYENEFLQDMEREEVLVPRYYNLPGTDEFLVTYTYMRGEQETLNSEENVEEQEEIIQEEISQETVSQDETSQENSDSSNFEDVFSKDLFNNEETALNLFKMQGEGLEQEGQNEEIVQETVEENNTEVQEEQENAQIDQTEVLENNDTEIVENQETITEDNAIEQEEQNEEIVQEPVEENNAEEQEVEEDVLATANINVRLVLMSGVESDNKINIKESNENCKYILGEETSNVVSLSKEKETEKIAKSYFYANKIEEQYEVSVYSKTIINVSYKDIIEEIEIADIDNLYKDKEGNTYQNDDLYYKELRIQYVNYLEMLGEQGEIRILDEDGNVIAIINNDNEVNDEGIIVVPVEGYTKLRAEISRPIAEGNIIIEEVKAMRNISMERNEIMALKNIANTSVIRAKYTTVAEKVDVESKEFDGVKLADTETMATLSLDKTIFSTLEENRDVEITIELNNAREESDLYGHSEFEIEFPEYIENIEITDRNIVVGEGLELTSAEVTDARHIKIVLDGMQKGINSGALTNGTNIILMANITVNRFTPSTSKILRLFTQNDAATNYNSNGVYETAISFTAPTGVVAVNSLYNFNGDGSFKTSVNQGKEMAVIDTYTGAKTVTEEILVMNNYQNEVSNFSILGRFPFEGNKDEYGNTLGTTLTPRIITGITGSERNEGQFDIYYSTNGEATKDLSLSENDWIKDPESFDNMKSYLIVPISENEENEYVLKQGTVLKFTYQFEIPENLGHNVYIYSTFTAYYRNLSEIVQIDEMAVPDIVGLTTGEGPELALEITTDKTEVKEYEMIEVTVKAVNRGTSYVEDVVVNFNKQNNATFYSYEIINGESNWAEDSKEVKSSVKRMYFETADGSQKALEDIANSHPVENEWPLKVSQKRLDPGEAVEFKVILQANELLTENNVTYVEGIPEGLSDEERARYIPIGENIYSLVETGTKVSEGKLTFEATATAKDFNEEIRKKSNEVLVKPADIRITEIAREYSGVLKSEESLYVYLNITNQREYPLRNVRITKYLSDELEYEDAYITANDENHQSVPDKYGEYNDSSREITWNLDEIGANETILIYTLVKGKKLENGIALAIGKTTTEVSADGIDTYQSMPVVINVGQPVLIINQQLVNESEYVKEGEDINYRFIIRNDGPVTADGIELTDNLPDGVYAQAISYEIEGKKMNQSITSRDKVVVNTRLDAKQTLIVDVGAVAGSLNGEYSKEVENAGNVSANNANSENSEIVKVTIEAAEKTEIGSDKSNGPGSDKNTNSSKSNSSSGGIGRYNISGLVWLDMNRDGMRSTGESMMSQITVDFDTEKYRLTTYQKSGIASNANSDFISKEVEQEGKVRISAISDIITINGGSISGLDAGFVIADVFDFEIDKTITKVTVQTSKGTTTENYDNVKLAKTEIASKNLVGSTVYVEYEIKVSNVGDIKGNVKKIVDYIPQGMTFNSTLSENAKWYTGTDGNLYTEEFANKELARGQSATIKLVLTRRMTEENTGIINNQAEIFEAFNKNGYEDINSKPGNRAQDENDLSKADIAIMVKTGESLIYASIIMTTISLGIIVVFIAYTQMVSARNKKRMLEDDE